MSALFDSLGRRVRLVPRESHSALPRAGVQDDAVVAVLSAHHGRRGHEHLVAVVLVALICAGVPGWLAWRHFGVRPQTGAPPPQPGSDPNYRDPARLGVRPQLSARARVSGSDPGAVAAALPAAPVNATRTLAVAVADRPAPSAGRDDLALAMYFHRSGDFENALLHYRAVLRHNELDAQAHNNLGLLYQEKNLFAESARELQRAIIINPGYRAAHNNYGVTLLRQGRLDEAIAEFQAVLAGDPNNVDALVNLALAEKSAGQPDRGRESLLRALAVAPDSAAAHYNLAVLYDDSDPPRALEHYKAFLESSRGDFAADRAAAVRARVAVLQAR